MLHSDGYLGSWYDTGASFLEECKRIGAPARYLRIDDFILHFKGGSWAGKASACEWLDANRHLYE